jgi:hypothetical protein
MVDHVAVGGSARIYICHRNFRHSDRFGPNTFSSGEGGVTGGVGVGW